MTKDRIWSHEKFCIEGNSLWFVPYTSGILCRFDVDSAQVNIAKILSDNLSLIDQYINIIKYDKYIVAVPSYSNVLRVYDIDDDIFYDYSLEKKCSGNFFSAAAYDDCVVIFPFCNNVIIKITFDALKPKFEEYHSEINGFVSCVNIQKWLILVKQDGGIYKYNKETNEITMSVEIDAAFIDLCVIRDDEVLVLDSEGDFYLFYPLDNRLFKKYESKIKYHSIAVRNGYVYAFLEKTGEYFDKYNLNDFSLNDRIYIEKASDTYQWKWHAFSKTSVYDNRIYVMNIMQQCFMQVDEDDSIHVYSIGYPELKYEDKICAIKRAVKTECVVECSTTGMDLPLFLSSLSE